MTLCYLKHPNSRLHPGKPPRQALHSPTNQLQLDRRNLVPQFDNADQGRGCTPGSTCIVRSAICTYLHTVSMIQHDLPSKSATGFLVVVIHCCFRFGCKTATGYLVVFIYCCSWLRPSPRPIFCLATPHSSRSAASTPRLGYLLMST